MEIKYGYAKAKYAGNGVTTDFAVPFPYLKSADVFVSAKNADGSEWLGALGWTFINASLVKITQGVGGPAFPTGMTVWVERNSAFDGQRVDFTEPSTITEKQLDLAYRQAFYTAEEALDTAGMILLSTANIDQAVNFAVAAKVAAQAAQAAATTSASNAATSAAGSASSAAAAAASAVAAAAAASGVTDPLGVYAMLRANNLSDLNNAGTARTNIGLGSVENKSSATIRGEIVLADVNAALTGPVTAAGSIRSADYVEANNNFVANAYYNAGWKRRNAATPALVSGDWAPSSYSFLVAPAGAVDSAIGWIEALRIGNAGGLFPQSHITFGVNGQRIFVNSVSATRANRTLFQEVTANSSTGVGVIPSGTGQLSLFVAYNRSDPDNASAFQFLQSDTASIINATKFGAGTTQTPILLQIAGATKATLDVNGILGIGVTPGATSTASLETAKAISSPSFISVHSYGAVGDFNPATGTGTDDRAAIQAALDASYALGGGTVTLEVNKKYKIGSPLIVPTGVTLRGPHGQMQSGWRGAVGYPAVQANPATNGGIAMRSMGGSIWVCFDAGRGNQTLPNASNPSAASDWTNSATYDVTDMAGLPNYTTRTAAIYVRGTITGCYVLQSSYYNPVTNSAYSGSATFNRAWNSGFMSGLAIRGDAEDACVRGCFIGGFMQAMLSYNEARFVAEDNLIDCVNGIEVCSSYDVATVRRNHAFQFSTAGYNQGSLMFSGTFIWFHEVTDWARCIENFTFGHKVGFKFYNVGGVQVANCGADNYDSIGTFTGAYGIWIIGTVQNLSITNFKTANREYGVYSDPGAGQAVTTVGVNTAACGTGIHVQSGNFTVVGGHFEAGANGIKCGVKNVGAGVVKSVNPTFTAMTNNTLNTGAGTNTLL